MPENIYSVSLETLPPLPQPVTNNAVTSVKTASDEFLVSFNGLGPGRTWQDTLSHTYIYSSKTNNWRRGQDVPDGRGRLASVAVSLGPYAYVFGGYTVEEDHSEVSLPFVHRYDPVHDTFERLSNMPVPVDDAVALTFQERFIYLISGWHDKGNVNLVQRYDSLTDHWDQATPYPGNPVFGHAGGIVGNRLVICDGVRIKTHLDKRREFVVDNNCFSGVIDEDDTRSIEWRKLTAHPGAPRYRMASAGLEFNTIGEVIMFAGGSDNAYNYNGTGYNGAPSEPSQDILVYQLETGKWLAMPDDSNLPTMDHRGLILFEKQVLTIGGMTSNQRVIPDVKVITSPEINSQQ